MHEWQEALAEQLPSISGIRKPACSASEIMQICISGCRGVRKVNAEVKAVFVFGAEPSGEPSPSAWGCPGPAVVDHS